jgi:NAD(P)-dependent dehydrogenase (short-subunit alcohol dehydrogenase family)
MCAAMNDLAGRVALVLGADRDAFRAIALFLAARGVRVVVAGEVERRLAELVGEIAFGGGKARHIAVDVRDPEAATRAVAKARDAFGGLDLVVGTPDEVRACAAAAGGAAEVHVDEPSPDALDDRAIGAHVASLCSEVFAGR